MNKAIIYKKIAKLTISLAINLAISISLYTNVAYAKQEEKKLQDGWRELKECKLIDTDSNDGDSFHVQHMGKEYVFRLYLADCPESNLTEISRNVEQMKEFEAPLDKLLTAGKIATELTKQMLSAPFTVITKGEDAMGRSKLGRIYAFIKTSNGSDLAEILLEQGLARSHGKNADAPKVRADIQSKYDNLAQRAKKAKIGAWGNNTIKFSSNSMISNTDISKAERAAQELENKNKEEIGDIAKYLGEDSPIKTSNATKINTTAIRPSQQRIIKKEGSIFYTTTDAQTPSKSSNSSDTSDPSNTSDSNSENNNTEQAEQAEQGYTLPTVEMDTSIFNTTIE